MGMGQTKISRLVLKEKEKYFIKDTDILIIDTLIMRDSSVVLLNPLRKVNSIYSKVTIIGKGCSISSLVTTATKSERGAAGADQYGPCVHGKNGGNGSPGSPGQSANNLFLYFTDLNITGTLTINLVGGEGGDGGDGGPGGSGGPGTRLCAGGNGGNGGNGAVGGHGGDGGTLSIQCKNCPTLRGLINTFIFVKNYGGYAGLGGDGGIGGAGRLGPINDGTNGKKGKPGKDGAEGKNGAIHFISK